MTHIGFRTSRIFTHANRDPEESLGWSLQKPKLEERPYLEDPMVPFRHPAMLQPWMTDQSSSWV